MSADATLLSESLELTRVRFFEISAKVSESSEPKSKPSDKIGPEGSGEPLELFINIKAEKKTLGLRVVMELTNEYIMARIDCAAFFRKLDPERNYDHTEIREFIRHEAFPVIVPYIREALADISRRVIGRPITLGLIRLNDMLFTNDPVEIL